MKVWEYLRYGHWLSINISLGAISVLFLISRVLGESLDWPVYTSLFCAVWFIYLADHLLDDRESEPYSPRRTFYRRQRLLLLLCLSFCGIFGVLSLLYLPRELIFAGLALMLICGLYLRYSKPLGLLGLKEFVIALCYSSGIFLVPLLHHFSAWVVGMALVLVLLAFTNLLIFSFFERSEDLREGHPSFVGYYGEDRASKLIWILSFSVLIGSFFGFYLVPSWWKYHVFVLLSSLVYLVLVRSHKYFGNQERYRWIADGVFFFTLPLAFW